MSWRKRPFGIYWELTQPSNSNPWYTTTWLRSMNPQIYNKSLWHKREGDGTVFAVFRSSCRESSNTPLMALFRRAKRQRIETYCCAITWDFKNTWLFAERSVKDMKPSLRYTGFWKRLRYILRLRVKAVKRWKRKSSYCSNFQPCVFCCFSFFAYNVPSIGKFW